MFSFDYAGVASPGGSDANVDKMKRFQWDTSSVGVNTDWSNDGKYCKKDKKGDKEFEYDCLFACVGSTT